MAKANDQMVANLLYVKAIYLKKYNRLPTADEINAYNIGYMVAKNELLKKANH